MQQRPLQSYNATTVSFLCKRRKSQNPRAATDTQFWNVEMASNNGSVGKWEVVKKGKKSSNSTGTKNSADKKSGGGGRKALSESNLPTRRKWPWPSRVLLASDTASSAPPARVWITSGAKRLVRFTNPDRFLKWEFRRPRDSDKIRWQHSSSNLSS